MSLLTWPNLKLFCPATCTISLLDNLRMTRSEETGSVQASERPGSRWKLDLTWSARYNRDLAQIEAKIHEGRGRVNTWSLWHFARPIPRGLMTGTPTVLGNHAQGALQMQILTVSGNTFLPGDMFSVNGQLLQCVNCTGTGTLTVGFVPNLKAAVATDTVVVYTRPTAPFRLLNSVAIPYSPVASPGFSASFEEDV